MRILMWIRKNRKDSSDAGNSKDRGRGAESEWLSAPAALLMIEFKTGL